MKSSVVKRSIVIKGHKTSVSLEDAFWQGLKEIAGGRNITLSQLVAAIDAERNHSNLSSAIRIFVLSAYRDPISDQKADPLSNWLPNAEYPVGLRRNLQVNGRDASPESQVSELARVRHPLLCPRQ